MSLLLKVIHAAHCRSTHHKLAIDALSHLRCPRPLRWRDMFLQYHEDYLAGAKDPDTKFKDFRNHVLHVSQNNWGGAVKKTREWYDKTVDALKHRDWPDAAYCAGVMSHYYSDPLMPFHTGQSQAESNIHRATEWSICKTYEELRRIGVEDLGLPEIDAPRGSEWLETMVLDGANASHRCYDALVQQYDFAAGSKNPPAGLNSKCRKMLAMLLGHATVGLACILDEAIEEADIRAPRCDLTVATFIATVKMPSRWITKKLADAEDRALVEAMFREYEETGKVEKNLPEDDRVIRDLVAEELGDVSSHHTPCDEVEDEVILTDENEATLTTHHEDDAEAPAAVPMPSMQTPEDIDDEEWGELESEEVDEELVGEDDSLAEEDDEYADAEVAHEDEEVFEEDDELDAEDDEYEEDEYEEDEEEEAEAEVDLRFYLDRASDVVDAPSIGPKTAKRLRKIGVRTVNDLLQLDPEEAAEKLNARHITADVLADWQDQAALVCCVPQIRGHDAQILVACGYRDAEALATADVDELLAETDAFAETTEGQRVIRSSNPPDEEEVTNWIAWAEHARPLKAA